LEEDQKVKAAEYLYCTTQWVKSPKKQLTLKIPCAMLSKIQSYRLLS